MPHSGWPFGIEALAPYYEPASRLAEVAPGRFDELAYWQAVTGEPIPALPTDRMRLQFVHFSPPTRFGVRYREQLARDDRIRVLPNANVTRIAVDANAQTVTGLSVRTLDQLGHQIRARYYVLATGGLENARMLLLSNDVVKAGLGNQHDLVGRFFMEHVHPQGFGEMVVADLAKLPEIFYQRWAAGERFVQAAFKPSEAFLRRERLLNASFMVGVAARYGSEQAEPAGAQTQAHRDMLLAARPLLTDDLGGAEDRGDPQALGVWLGMGGNHHMGTTRMSDDPKAGVVNRRGRVHGIDNLYVAGSSVFPTSGVSNPTLTLLALTLRLADHLEEQLR